MDTLISAASKKQLLMNLKMVWKQNIVRQYLLLPDDLQH